MLLAGGRTDRSAEAGEVLRTAARCRPRRTERKPGDERPRDGVYEMKLPGKTKGTGKTKRTFLIDR